MDTTIVVALIGAIATVASAVIGANVGRSNWFQKNVARNPFPELDGTRLESTWTNIADGKPRQYKEVIEIKSQKRGRLYGNVTMDENPALRWDVEGDFDGRFLRLFWHASRDSQNKFYLDHGCYFFERQGDGTFKGYSVGFDARLNKVAVDEHTIRQLASPKNS